MVNESTGFTQWIYEWNTDEAARFYVASFALQFMLNRSVPGSVSFEIIPH